MSCKNIRTIFFVGDTEQARILRFLSEHRHLFVSYDYRYFHRHPLFDGKIELTFSSTEQQKQFEAVYQYNIAYLKPSPNG